MWKRFSVLAGLAVTVFTSSSWLRSNWIAVQANGGIGSAYEAGAILLPIVVGLACFAAGFWIINSDHKSALLADPPVVPNADETLVSLDAPGVSLRAKLDNQSAVDPEFRKRVVASVASALEVRATEVAKK